MDALSLMLLRGTQIDPRAVRDMVQRQTQRRIHIGTRLIDLIFGFVMYFWGGLKFTATDGHTLSDDELKRLTTEDKLNALITGMKSTDKSTRFREFFRPLLIDAAEFIANMMAPDELMLSLLTGGPIGGGGTWVPANPAAPLAPGVLPASVAPAAPASNLPMAGPYDLNAMPGSPNNPLRVQNKPGGSY